MLCIYFVRDACLLCVAFVSVFQYYAKRLAEKKVTKMTYFVSGGM